MVPHKVDIARLIELARAQLGEPGDWSLAVDAGWLERSYFGPSVTARFWEHPAGELIGSAAVAAPSDRGASAATVVSMLRLDREDLWGEQHAWIEAQLREASAGTTIVRSESVTDAELRRWTEVGFRLVFEELVMERDLDAEPIPSPPRWPVGAQLLEWGPAAAEAGYRAYVEAFRDRPGFPGWSRSEWIDRLTGYDDFLASASMCVLMNGVPAGYVVCTAGWIHQLGVAPSYRRIGIACALAGEAVMRMGQQTGIRLVRLHVNVNNPDAIAAWNALGWQEMGRAARLERRLAPG
jgi:ribosomal protein S18 acetylase RimI-like enzyme